MKVIETDAHIEIDEKPEPGYYLGSTRIFETPFHVELLQVIPRVYNNPNLDDRIARLRAYDPDVDPQPVTVPEFPDKMFLMIVFPYGH